MIKEGGLVDFAEFPVHIHRGVVHLDPPLLSPMFNYTPVDEDGYDRNSRHTR